MQKRLPEIDSPEAREIRRRWEQASPREKKTLATGWGVTKGTLANFVSGVNPEVPQFESEPYPSFDIVPPAHATRAEEDIGIICTDWHTGKKTTSYNTVIFRRRIEYLTERILSIIDLHKPIRKAHIMFCGDMAQGENIYQGSGVEDAEMGARLQIKQVLIPTATSMCVSVSQVVQEVELYGVPGNHGKPDKASPSGTNWDLFFYDLLESALINNDRIHVHPSHNFYQLINIRGYRFFIIHGDQVNATAGIPLFAMRRKMQDWYAHVGGFHYAYAGHFHSAAADQVNSVADYAICPPLVTGDAWALEKVGRASKPVQLCFGVHNKYGRTWEYKLYTDDKYLPSPFDEPEGEIQVTA